MTYLNIKDQFTYISLTLTPHSIFLTLNKKTLLSSQQEQDENKQTTGNEQKKNYKFSHAFQ